MKVFLLNIGEYAGRGCIGVYTRLELAKAAVSDANWRRCGSDDCWESDKGDRYDIEPSELEGPLEPQE